ncbi:hypothetical protein A9255_15680 [Xenorhabdus hominickii]|uniref:Uncharacterized protein n=1 Tax=Xenorhabdus hominickii TaxID=351679 RepID=A0ABM6DUX1_XENHO|nr:hypothetical protein A9255_15680 [Xenorhabdus hominickii]
MALLSQFQILMKLSRVFNLPLFHDLSDTQFIKEIISIFCFMNINPFFTVSNDASGLYYHYRTQTIIND